MTPETITLPRETVEAYVALMRVIEAQCEPRELRHGNYAYICPEPAAVGDIVAAWRVARKAGG